MGRGERGELSWRLWVESILCHWAQAQAFFNVGTTQRRGGHGRAQTSIEGKCARN
eukprot:COSAG01_NODE_69795_length_260_cov_0.869565_1_plen_54_part_10